MTVMSVVPADSPRRFKVASPVPQGRAGNSGAEKIRIAGIGPMTNVRTDMGDFPAQALRERDMVRVRSGGYMPIRSIRRVTFDEDFIRYHPGAQPVVFNAGSLGRGMPEQDLVVAPFQRFGADQEFVQAERDPAITWLGKPRIWRKPEQIITYTLIDLGSPEEILCDGVWVQAAG